MTHVECIIVDLKTNVIKGRYYKEFTDPGEFNSWYRVIKNDISLILNIMKYNPMEKPLQKQINDVKLLSVSREMCV